MTRGLMREFHRRLVDLYFNEGWSNAAVAKYGGCSAAWVKKLVKQAAARGRSRSKIGTLDPRKRDNRWPLSGTHAFIGVCVARHRAKLRLSMATFGDRVRLSRFRVGQVEAGAHDLTILEVIAIADELGQSVEMLLGKGDRRQNPRRRQ